MMNAHRCTHFSRGGGGGRLGTWYIFLISIGTLYAGFSYIFFRPMFNFSFFHSGGQVMQNVKVDDSSSLNDIPSFAGPGTLDGVVVLGMHRSGTSMITGLLERMGLHLGPPESLLGAAEGENDKDLADISNLPIYLQAGENDRGFFERMEVIAQNDDVMKDQDVNWALNVYRFDHVKALRQVLTDPDVFHTGQSALAYYNDPAHIPWGVKDPRLCITLKFWLPFFRNPPAVLFVYRHPVEVGKSLVRRKEFGFPRALHLWIAYNRLAIENSRGLCRVITSDAALVRDGYHGIQTIYQKLRACGVAVPRMAEKEDVEEFIDSKLRHHKQDHRDECRNLKPWESEAIGHEREREEAAYQHAMRVYCALEDGSAFSLNFVWETLPDYAPP